MQPAMGCRRRQAGRQAGGASGLAERHKSLLPHIVKTIATVASPSDAPPPVSPDSLSLLYPLPLLPVTPTSGEGLAPRPPLCLRRSVLPLAAPAACEAATGERWPSRVPSSLLLLPPLLLAPLFAAACCPFAAAPGLAFHLPPLLLPPPPSPLLAARSERSLAATAGSSGCASQKHCTWQVPAHREQRHSGSAATSKSFSAGSEQ